MRALVTGGTGFIGLALGRALAAQGAEVTLADVRPREALVDYPAKVRAADLAEWAEVLHLVADARPEVVFHCGALLSATAEELPRRAWRANADGTVHVLEAATLFEVRQVVLLSSIASYGPGVPEVVDETTPQRPITMYGVTKVLAELLGEYYARRFGLDVRAARYPSVIGPGRGPGGASAYSTLMIEEPAAGRGFAVPVPEDVVMPLLYVDDAVRSLLELRGVPAPSLRRRTYGIDGFSPSAGEIAAAVRARIPKAHLDFAPDDAVTTIVRSWPRVLSGGAARADWGWQPRYLLEETVDEFIAKVRGRQRPVSP
jgi:threonine 3-dehydrogenase